ncbi:hypothetical protein DICVIV_01714 [Dictyocaulus viviparus]|uniref:Uncharacterized protein n=1 Tax=Dictyocaulus viviparus TaxID=29172 RepID=A0A0D8Y5H7_DICVI|nr:hypothetical protein DICVIV_01714 [Dictyocaulus viviparus]
MHLFIIDRNENRALNSDGRQLETDTTHRHEVTKTATVRSRPDVGRAEPHLRLQLLPQAGQPCGRFKPYASICSELR